MVATAQLHALVEEHAHAVSACAPQEHGFAHFDPEFAHNALEHMPARIREQGRLAGWIIPAKDLADVHGLPTSLGNTSRRYLAEKTDDFVAAYQLQGALISGKSQTSELGLSAYTEPVHSLAPHNPRFSDPRTPGGSSGGAAVMVARGLVRAAHGSDGGGSLRVPAAACGIVGFKPAHNTARANPVAQGFLTRTVADAAYLHGLTPRTSRSLRIGVLTTPVHASVEVAPHMLEALEECLPLLSQAGHQVRRVQVPYDQHPFQAFRTILCARSATIPGDASPLVSWLRKEGQQLTPADVHQAMRTFLGVRGHLERTLDVDVLLSPTLAFDPPRIGYFSSMAPPDDFHAQTQWTPWATMFNMSGQAALSVPVGGYGPVLRPSVHLGAVHATSEELLHLATVIEHV